MEMLHKMIMEGVESEFLMEILWRSLIMFLLVLVVLRLSGKRGVRQLTLFEVAIILSLGSAAGDPMFQEEIPILYGVIVLLTVIALYKVIAWAAAEFIWFHKMMEGTPVTIIRDGRFVVNSRKNLNFSKREFFAELRNESVEHLGQVRCGVLEVDGTLSLLYFEKEDVSAGLPLFPDEYHKVSQVDAHVIYVCMYCGQTSSLEAADEKCARCGRREWVEAMSRTRSGV